MLTRRSLPAVAATVGLLITGCTAGEVGSNSSTTNVTAPGDLTGSGSTSTKVPTTLSDSGFAELFFADDKVAQETEALHASALRDCVRGRGFEILSDDQRAALNPVEAKRYRSVLDTDYYDQLKSDPVMVAAIRSWAACVESQTGLLSTTGSPLELARGSIGLIREADIYIRQGRTVRWLTLAEADQLDTSTLEDPVDMVIDGESEIGYVASGPVTSTAAAITERVEEIDTIDATCWSETDGPARISELQLIAMERVAELDAASG